MSAAKTTVLDNLVRNQVEKRPEKTAILFQKQSISYEAFANDFNANHVHCCISRI